MTPLTIICPSISRPTLRDTLMSVRGQLGPDDEFWLVSDGEPNDSLLENWTIALRFGLLGRLVKVPGPHNDWGHTPRKLILEHIQERPGYVVYIDDDDIFTPWAFAGIRRAIAEAPDGIFLFRMAYGDGRVIWHGERLESGNISTQMIVHPTQPPLGVWNSPYYSDTKFIQETVAVNPDRPLVWRYEIIAQIGQRHGTPLVGEASDQRRRYLQWESSLLPSITPDHFPG